MIVIFDNFTDQMGKFGVQFFLFFADKNVAGDKGNAWMESHLKSALEFMTLDLKTLEGL